MLILFGGRDKGYLIRELRSEDITGFGVSIFRGKALDEALLHHSET